MRFECRKIAFVVIVLLIGSFSFAQDNFEYKLPPKEMQDLLLAKPTPSVSIDSKGEWMLMSERSSYPTVEELGQPEIRVAGLRINPNNYAYSRQAYIDNFSLKNIKTKKEYKIIGLPVNMKAANVQWSPNEKKIVFTNTTANSVDAYIININTQTATKINKRSLNTNFGGTIVWHGDDALLYKVVIAPASSKPKQPIKPKAPTV
ncbi:MAG: S9 family peptidase, partial [Chitinophagaceae bacterium]|nr:S9 family peptidase [Chitinophagaceae bacterium]